MSFTLLSKLRKALPALRKPSYTASHAAVMLCLADRINDRTGICFPSMDTIADESYIGKRQARKVVSQLEADGIVEVLRFPRRSSHYRLHINMAKPTDKPLANAVAEPGLSAGQTVADNPSPVADARLTYNSNLLNNPVRDSSSICLTEHAILANSLLTEPGSTGQSPANRSELHAPCKEVRDLHSLLMKKIGSKTPMPSATDARLLQTAIDEYGLSEMYLLIEWIFKQKNKFWREKLKQAGRPCSFLSSSLRTMKTQLDAREIGRNVAAAQRPVDRDTATAESDSEESSRESAIDEVDFDALGLSADDLAL